MIFKTKIIQVDHPISHCNIKQMKTNLILYINTVIPFKPKDDPTLKRIVSDKLTMKYYNCHLTCIHTCFSSVT